MDVRIKDELLRVTEIDGQRIGELEFDFALRLVRAVNKLPDEKWDKLSRRAQKETNEAISCLGKILRFTNTRVSELHLRQSLRDRVWGW